MLIYINCIISHLVLDGLLVKLKIISVVVFIIIIVIIIIIKGIIFLILYSLQTQCLLPVFPSGRLVY